MMIKHFLLLAIALIVPMTASAQNTKRIPLPPSQNPTNADLPIAAAPAGDRGALVEIDVIAVSSK